MQKVNSRQRWWRASSLHAFVSHWVALNCGSSSFHEENNMSLVFWLQSLEVSSGGKGILKQNSVTHHMVLERTDWCTFRKCTSVQTFGFSFISVVSLDLMPAITCWKRHLRRTAHGADMPTVSIESGKQAEQCSLASLSNWMWCFPTIWTWVHTWRGRLQLNELRTFRLSLLENNSRIHMNLCPAAPLLSHTQQGLFAKRCTDYGRDTQDVQAKNKKVETVCWRMNAAKYIRSANESDVREQQQFAETKKDLLLWLQHRSAVMYLLYHKRRSCFQRERSRYRIGLLLCFLRNFSHFKIVFQ